MEDFSAPSKKKALELVCFSGRKAASLARNDPFREVAELARIRPAATEQGRLLAGLA
jgi:hypothetical protein